MDSKEFDKYIKSKIQNSESVVPDGMFERIMAEQNRRRPVAFIPKYLMVGLLAVIAAGAGYFTYKKLNTNNNSLESIAENKAIEKIVTENNTSSQTDNTNQTTENSNNSPVNETSEHFNDNNLKNNNTQTEQSSIENNTVNNSDDKNKTTKKNSNKTDEYIVGSGPENDYDFGFDVVRTNESTNAGSVSDKNFKPKYAAVKQARNSKSVSGEMLKANNKLKSSTPASLAVAASGGSIDCPPAGQKPRNDFYVEGYLSPDFSFKKYNNQALPQHFGMLKDSTESQMLGFTAGLRVSKSISEHWLIKAGLQYSQINERFKFRSEGETRITTVITIRQVVRLPGDTVYVSDTSTVRQTGYRVMQGTNTYKNFDLPVLFSYEFGHKESGLKYAVTAGPIFNLTTKSSGNIVTKDYRAEAFDNKHNKVYKNNWGMSFYTGISIIKNVSPKLDVFAEPYYRFRLSNMANYSAGFKQKFNTAGISFGLRYNLNKVNE